MSFIAEMSVRCGSMSEDQAALALLSCPDMCLFQLAEARLGAQLKHCLLEFFAACDIEDTHEDELKLRLDCRELGELVVTWSALTQSWRAEAVQCVTQESAR